MKRCAVALVVVGLFGATARSQAGDDPVIVPVTLVHGLVFVDVELPDQAPVLALFDTGANASAIDPRRAGELSMTGTSEVVGTTGTLAVEMVTLDGLRLGAFDLPALSATRRSLAGLLAPAGRTVGMILGSDAFSGLVVTLDFEERRLEVTRKPPDESAGGVLMILDNGIPAIEAEIGGIDVWLRIDTGATLFDTDDVYINVPERTWAALRDRHPDLAPSTHFKGTGADGETVDLPVAPVPGARVGPLSLDRVFVIVQPEAGYFADPDAKGFVSNNFLRQFGRVTLDYATGRLIGGG
jgi:hypothetical protein